jgi:hypothetical protein
MNILWRRTVSRCPVCRMPGCDVTSREDTRWQYRCVNLDCLNRGRWEGRRKDEPDEQLALWERRGSTMTKTEARRLDAAVKALAQHALRPTLSKPGVTMLAWDDEVERLRQALEETIVQHLEGMGL